MAATAFAKLAVAFTAKTTSFTRGVSRATKSLLGFSKSSKRASRSGRLVNQMLGRMGALVGGAAIVGGFFRLVRSVEEFNQAMNKSTAIMGDVSEEMRQKILKSAHDVAFATKHSADEVAKAYYYLIRRIVTYSHIKITVAVEVGGYWPADPGTARRSSPVSAADPGRRGRPA